MTRRSGIIQGMVWFLATAVRDYVNARNRIVRLERQRDRCPAGSQRKQQLGYMLSHVRGEFESLCRWIDKGTVGKLTFNECCEAAGYDPDVIRTGLRAFRGTILEALAAYDMEARDRAAALQAFLEEFDDAPTEDSSLL